MGDGKELLIYGAYGFTGELIARRAVEVGMTPVLAGRDPAKLAPLADDLGLESRAFPLDDPGTVDAGLDGAAVVLHCAGPFEHTFRAMADACLRTGAHYLDITGEVLVFEALASRDEEARGAGVMLMPGTGFDVVPSDCLAAHLAARLPGATHLALAFSSVGGRFSRGTATTMAENLHRGALVRENGTLKAIPAGSRVRDIDYGRGPRSSMAIPWGDVSTAFHSTGIPNLEVYMTASRKTQRGARVANHLGWVLGTATVQRWLRGRIHAAPPGPDAAERDASITLLWGEVRDADGGTRISRMQTPNGYSLTATTAIEIARRALDGEARAGFQTPSRVFGADFVLGFEGVKREDLG